MRGWGQVAERSSRVQVKETLWARCSLLVKTLCYSAEGREDLIAVNFF
jgi:hypothetical protein